jgi:plasmid stabilization system protein ParE
MTTSAPNPQAAVDRRRPLPEGLESMARQSEDAAASCQAAYDHHYPEFSRITENQASQEDHERLLELYGHVFPNRNEAQRLRWEAGLLREAAARLRRHEEIFRKMTGWEGLWAATTEEFPELAEMFGENQHE